jgi:hypothetical protein
MMKWKQSYYISIYQDLHTHDMVRGIKTLHCIIYHKNGNMTYDWESQNGPVVAEPDLKSDTLTFTRAQTVAANAASPTSVPVRGGH